MTFISRKALDAITQSMLRGIKAELDPEDAAIIRDILHALDEWRLNCARLGTNEANDMRLFRHLSTCSPPEAPPALPRAVWCTCEGHPHLDGKHGCDWTTRSTACSCVWQRPKNARHP